MKGINIPDHTGEQLVINDRLSIPIAELRFSFAKSSGPGGQHVNKVNTKATLYFDVRSSPSLSESARQRILAQLSGRISKNGVLRVSSLKHRSQTANRQAALERFGELLREALRQRKKRRATKPSRASKEKRIALKKHRAMIKRTRGGGGIDQE